MAQESGSGNWRRLPGPFSSGPVGVLRADPSAESAAQRGLVDRVAEPLADEHHWTSKGASAADGFAAPSWQTEQDHLEFQQTLSAESLPCVDKTHTLDVSGAVQGTDDLRGRHRTVPLRGAVRHPTGRFAVPEDDHPQPEGDAGLQEEEVIVKRGESICGSRSATSIERTPGRAKEGIPYQTLLSSVIHKHLSGRLTEKR